MSTPISATRRIVVGLACAMFLVGGSAAAYWAGIPDEAEIKRRLEHSRLDGAAHAFRILEHHENATMRRLAMVYQRDPASDEELVTIYDTNGPRPDSVLMQLHRKGIYMSKFDGKFRNLTRDYSGEDWLWQADGLAVVNASYGRAELWSPDGKRQLGEITLDRLHRIAEVEFWKRGTRLDPSTSVWTVEYGAGDIPTFRAPPHRNPIMLSGARNQTPNILHASDLWVDGAVPPHELSLHFLTANGGVVDAVGFERSMDNRTFSFHWVDWNRNGLVDTSDAIEYRFPPSVKEVRIFDEWADAYAFQSPAGGIVLVLSLAIAAGFARRRRAA